MKTPSFSYMGGKCRIRNWLVSYFPKSGNRYIEPFVGLGNVFYQSRKDLHFNSWYLSDIDISFFEALLRADLDQLPERVYKDDYIHWRNSGSDIARVIEPRITFGGKGYGHGYIGEPSSLTHYNGSRYRLTCEEARRLLANVKIKAVSWDQLNWSKLTLQDFVYCDPPYFGTVASYPNIDHEALVQTLNAAKCKWALSGYDNPLYTSSLKFAECYKKSRNSEIKSSHTKKLESVTENLWTNYHN